MFTKNTLEDAVSPVVGVILIVAVTVILAAVIGSFVLDLGSNVQANPQAGVTFNQDYDSGTDTYDVDVQLISVENADSIYVTSSVAIASTECDGDASQDFVGGPDADCKLTSSGQTATVAGLNDNNDVTVIGELDGKQAVIQTYTVDA